MVDKINDEADLQATSETETVKRLIPVPVVQEIPEPLIREWLTPESDC